jgi:hypothetical protein
MSPFRCSGRTKVSVQVRGFVCEYFVTTILFHSEELLAPRPTPKLEGHPLSVVRDCLFNTVAYPGILFGGFNNWLRAEGRENGDLGGGGTP